MRFLECFPLDALTWCALMLMGVFTGLLLEMFATMWELAWSMYPPHMLLQVVFWDTFLFTRFTLFICCSTSPIFSITCCFMVISCPFCSISIVFSHHVSWHVPPFHVQTYTHNDMFCNHNRIHTCVLVHACICPDVWQSLWYKLGICNGNQDASL